MLTPNDGQHHRGASFNQSMGRWGQRADQPPSEAMVWPVIQSASSLSSHATRRAVSVGVLQHRPGVQGGHRGAGLVVGVAGVVGPGVDVVDGDAAVDQVHGQAPEVNSSTRPPGRLSSCCAAKALTSSSVALVLTA
jgi:hypothetical protein